MFFRLNLFIPSLLLAGSCMAQSPRHDLLKSLDQQRFTAQIQKDSLVLSRLLANDLIYTHSNGVVETKPAFIHSLLSGRWNYQTIDSDSVRVRFYGPVAVLTGRARITLLVADKPTPVTMMYTDVWHNQAKGKHTNWQLISWAATRLPNP